MARLRRIILPSTITPEGMFVNSMESLGYDAAHQQAEYIFRTVLPACGMTVREGQIQLCQGSYLVRCWRRIGKNLRIFDCMPALAMAAPARTMAAGGYFNGQRDLAGCFAAAVHSFFVECFNTIWIY